MCEFLFSANAVLLSSLLLVDGKVKGGIQCGKAFDARVGVGVIRCRHVGIGSGGRLFGGAGPRRLGRDDVGVRVPPTALRLGGVPAHMQGGG